MTTTRLPLLAVQAGIRTPFAKSFGALAQVPADELGKAAVLGLLDRAGVAPTHVDEVIFGNVSGQPDAANLGRVIALKAGIPHDRLAHTVNRNCASGIESVIAGWHVLAEGRANAVIAGGTESMSQVPLLWDRRVAGLMLEWKRASWWQKLGLLGRFRPSLLKPIPALELGLTDPTCGLNMGQTAEVLAREFRIGREAQDRFALESHQKAVAAAQAEFFADEIVPLPPVTKDTGPRANQSIEALLKLKPVFEKNGTVTPGNSCPLTDGAAALLLARADAHAGAREPLGYVYDYAVAGCDPRRMGLGPVYAIHKLLAKTGLRLDDFDLFEINEAFAVQVLACRQALLSDEFARAELGRDHAIGELPLDRLNVHGGAIALGHPVGTSGTRLILTLLRALRAKGLRRGLAALCVGGGQGAAVWVQTDREGPPEGRS